MPKPLSHWIKAEESRADEPTEQKTIRHSEPMEERKPKPPKSGSEEWKKRKTSGEDGVEESCRHDRRVAEPRAVSSLVKGEFPQDGRRGEPRTGVLTCACTW